MNTSKLTIIGFCTLGLSLAFNVTAIFLRDNLTLLPYFLVAGLTLVLVSVLLFAKSFKPEFLSSKKTAPAEKQVEETKEEKTEE